MLSRAAIEAAYERACRQEMEALKPGNVHVFADGHRMSAEQFLTSARVTAMPLTDPELGIGRRILDAVRATRETVGTNTNLGILLLSAPLARAAETSGDLRGNLRGILGAMDMADAAAVFEAIALASPGGLGTAEAHDVRQPPGVPLLDAMRSAAGRDRIARQYATGFEDVFETGLAALDGAAERGETGMWPTVSAYMAFLAAFPDSHVARKFGRAAAEEVRLEAASARAELERAPDDLARIELLGRFDSRLKARGINPGTSADLTVACLLVDNLRFVLHRGKVDD